MRTAAIEELFKRLAARHPHPKTELKYDTNFELLIAVMLSAQATDVSVNKVTAKLYPIANTPQALSAIGEANLCEHIKSIGLYRNKAKNIIATCQQLLTLHQGQVPDTREALQALPGVGRKTANVVLNVAFGHLTLAVDTHIFRVANRSGLAKAKTPEAVEQQLLKIIPTHYLQHAHHWLILHGRYTCKARTPACPSCEIKDLCQYKEKTPSL